MAEVDDFFAKKDKKKKGKKAKKFVGTNPTNISKALEVTAPPPSEESEKPKKDVLIDIPSNNAADDEWKEVEVAEENLEGLKVRSLRPDGSSDPVESVEKKEEEEPEAHEEAEVNTESSGGGSAWQPLPAKNTTEQENTVEEEEEPKEKEKEKTPPPSPPAPAKPAAYVPPARRNQSLQGPSREGGPTRGPGMGRRKQVLPPDIQSSEAFPTLGGN